MVATSEMLHDCKARAAVLGDLPAIVEFYKRNPAPAVYLRKPEEIEASINNELFFVVLNNDNEIIASSGIYLLNKGEEIAKCFMEDGMPIRAKVAELGSVLRRKGGLPKDRDINGVWHPLLFSVPMMLLFDRLRKGRFHADGLICDVKTSETLNMQRLTGAVKLTPLGWQIMNPGGDLISAFKATVQVGDSKVDQPKVFFRAPVSNLPEIARYLWKVCTQKVPTSAHSNMKGVLTNIWGGTLSIDMSELIERWTIGLDGEGRRYTLLGKLKEHTAAIIKGVEPNSGWDEFSRLFETNYRTSGPALNGPYHVRDIDGWDKLQSDYAMGMASRSDSVVPARLIGTIGAVDLQVPTFNSVSHSVVGRNQIPPATNDNVGKPERKSRRPAASTTSPTASTATATPP